MHPQLFHKRIQKVSSISCRVFPKFFVIEHFQNSKKLKKQENKHYLSTTQIQLLLTFANLLYVCLCIYHLCIYILIILMGPFQNKLQTSWMHSCMLSCSFVSNSWRSHEPGSSVHGILQARILEWVAIHFSRRSSKPRN